MAPILMDQIKRLLALACRLVLVDSIIVDETDIGKFERLFICPSDAWQVDITPLSRAALGRCPIWCLFAC
jgi:hypothetical protein